MDAAVPPAAAGAAFNSLDLDRLFHEGDDQTWDMEDWNWDPYQIMAEPKSSPTRANADQQALKRHKIDHNTAHTAAMQPAAAAPGGCHAGAVTAQQQQQGLNLGGFGSFQGLLNGIGGFGGNLDPAAWAQQYQQQQQQAMLAQMQQQQQQLAGSNAPAAAAGCGSACHPNAPAPLRSCQALAHGLPFLAAGNIGQILQQQQQQQDMLASHASLLASVDANAAAAVQQQGMAAAHGGPDKLGLGHVAAVGLDLSGPAAAAAAINPVAAALHDQHADLAAATAAAASPDGISISLAESGNEGFTAQIISNNTTAAAAPAVNAGSSALQQQQQQQQQQLASPSAIATPTGPYAAVAAAATDSEAAAVSVAVVDGSSEGDDDQKLVCQVPGCGRDLSGLKEYHQRYRICDVHIKLPQVMKEGRLQRFCQQCGRFHDLSAFDGNRKSCREQLQKHNARRRRRAQLEQNMSLADSLLTAVDDKSEVGKLLQGLLSNPFQLQALRVLLGVQTHPALPNPAPAPAEHMPQLVAAGNIPAAPAAAPPTYEVVRDIMDGAGSFAPTFDSEQRNLRLTAKFFNVTPADLPPDVRQQLTGWLGSAPAAVEGYIRPGCVLMTLHMTVDKSDYDSAVLSGMQRLLQQVMHPTAHPFWHTRIYMLQLFNTVAVIHHGQIISLTTLDDQALRSHDLPRQISVSPLCLDSSSSSKASLMISGHSISSADCTLTVKGRGSHLYLGSANDTAAAAAATNGCHCCQQQQAAAAAPEGGLSTCASVICEVDAAGVGCGVLWVEVAKGAFISEARPVLVVDDPQLAEEVAALQQLEGTTLSSTQVDSLLLDLGLVLGHIKAAPTAAAAAAAAAQRGLSHHIIAEKARRLIAFACDQGWFAVARVVLPLAQACGACAADIVAAIHDSTAQDGLSLLHRAVRSGSPALVRGILDWGTANNYRWPISAGGPRGVTPLHLASLLDDDGVIALMLLDACGAAGTSALTDARADDGVTPFHLAFQMGRYSLDRVLAGLGVTPVVKSIVEQQLQPNGWQMLKIAADAAEAAADADADLGAAAAVAAGKVAGSNAPLKERLTSCLDACLYCQSTLPPLLLSIRAKCAGCGVRQPCVQGDEQSTPSTLAAARLHHQQQAQAAAAAAAAAAVTLPVAADGAGCAHVNGRVLSVTALCQACHANRVLEVV